MDASPMAKGYYKLPDNAKWVDTLKCMVTKSQKKTKSKLKSIVQHKSKILCMLQNPQFLNLFLIRWQTRPITEM